MSRSQVRREWAKMLARGIVPVMEIDDPRGWVVVEVSLCKGGVWFSWDWEVEVIPRFDGAIRKLHGGWLISFAEIDRMGVQLRRCASTDSTDSRQRYRRGRECIKRPLAGALCCYQWASVERVYSDTSFALSSSLICLLSSSLTRSHASAMILAKYSSC